MELSSSAPKPSAAPSVAVSRFAKFRTGWTRDKFIARSKASGSHLALSAMVAICVTLPIVFWLYPSPFFEAAGGMHLLGLILGVDVVLGPALTFLVYDKSKASLRKDLATIAAVQICALFYGLFATAMSRPVYMTYVVDRFEMVSAAQVDPEELKRAPPELREVQWGHPQVAYAERPTDPEERSVLLFASIQGIDLGQTFRYYKPLEQGLGQIVSRARPIAELKKFNDPGLVDRVLEPLGKGVILAFVPMKGKRRDLSAVVDAKTGKLIKVVDLRPWS